MRVLVVGASGAIGSRLVPQLRARGHEVIGSSRSAAKAARLRELGAEPVVLDAQDGPAAHQLVARVEPDAIVYQATALAGGGFSRKLDTTFALTNQLRTRGADQLLAAARAAGVSRFVAQSFAPYRYAHLSGPARAEDDPLIASAPASARETFAAMSHVDEAVTVLALGHQGPAIYNITDDEPAATRDWLAARPGRRGRRPAAPSLPHLAGADDHGRRPGHDDRGAGGLERPGP